MEKAYILSIDQSTQGTKAMLFDETGAMLIRMDRPHRQIINEKGWVSHDPEEIWENVKDLAEKITAGVSRKAVRAVSISNQRETSVVWRRSDGRPVCDAVVWQCARAQEICGALEKEGAGDFVRNKTGLNLSPYFPAPKYAWILRNIPGAEREAQEGKLCFGTVDSWLIWKMTDGRAYKTDASNASRTELFDIEALQWDEELCALFGLKSEWLPEVCDSDSIFGETDFDGIFPEPVPICGVMGDSHCALFGQNGRLPGMVKATYGTGSSLMMNIGTTPIRSRHGLVTSLAWRMGGKTEYVLEGNLNYTGAVIRWIQEDVGLVGSADETEALAKAAVQDDELYLVPAFSGLGAPYWAADARAALCGMTRTTGRAEIVRAALECIAYQISDVLNAMEEDTGILLMDLRVDGGPTKNRYLMQFQSDISHISVLVPDAEELSGIGAARAAGLKLGLWDESVFQREKRTEYRPTMPEEPRQKKLKGWKDVLRRILD